MVSIRRDAVNESRKVKSGIPLIGMNNIPLRDEIELEMILELLGAQRPAPAVWAGVLCPYP